MNQQNKLHNPCRFVGGDNRIDFKDINARALPSLPNLLSHLLPNGKRQGCEWVALNPRRDDGCLGSFKINMMTGQWADFAVGDKGGDVISLVAYLFGESQGKAARHLQDLLGMGN